MEGPSGWHRGGTAAGPGSRRAGREAPFGGGSHVRTREQGRLWGAAAALAAAAALGCGGSGAKHENVAVQSQARLEAFDSCPALERHLEDEAVRDMRSQLEQSKEQVRRGGGFWYPPMEDVGAPAPSTPSAGGAAGGPQDFTTTNTQVAGVDEPDFVKNDGTRILALSGGRLQLARSWPADQLQTVASLAVEGWPTEMFFEPEKNRVTVLSSVYEQRPVLGIAAPCAMIEGCGGWGDNTTKLTVVDISTLSAPRVVDELYLPGSYQTARRVAGSLRVVLAEPFRWPQGVSFWPQPRDGKAQDKDALLAAFDALEDSNEALIRAQPLSTWVREGWRRRADGSRQDFGLSCGDFHRNTAPTRAGVMTVATVNLDAPEGSVPGRTRLLAEPGVVYATQDALYVASAHWWWWPEPGQQDHTYLHKFSLLDPARATYVATGGVDGYPKDQFSLDEREGVLRIATTVTRRLDPTPQAPWGPTETASRLWTLRQEGGQLAPLGKTAELAPGERVFAARFVGTRGFLVTFRQVDPLFTFDLSDPAHPRTVAELTLPGFSTYLHPLDEGHLLAVGEARDAGGTWQSRALKVSLFDVTDLAHPRELSTQTVGTSSGYSEALYSHKAFNYFPARGLLAIPFSDWTPSGSDPWGTFVSDLRLFSVSVEGGIQARGSLGLRDLYMTYGDAQWSYAWSPWVRRSVMADDFVYAISDAGIRVARQDALTSPLATAPFFLQRP
nr:MULTISPECIES: beta-propeller domain-containing protein [Myxococcaceae]